jgi:hypothetical protein
MHPSIFLFLSLDIWINYYSYVSHRFMILFFKVFQFLRCGTYNMFEKYSVLGVWIVFLIIKEMFLYLRKYTKIIGSKFSHC